MEKNAGGKLWIKIFWLWLAFAAIVTMMCGLAYLLIQQDIRQSANYPQSQVAEDVMSATTSLSAMLSGSGLIDISASLAPFLTTFDAHGNVIESNAVLDGSTPVPPHGVFAYTQANGEDRFTWQPEVGVRVAAVLVYHSDNIASSTSNGGFFALSGRSLRDVEILESRLADDTFFVWLSVLVVMFILSIFTAKVFNRVKIVQEINEEPKEKPIEKPTERPAQPPAPPTTSVLPPPNLPTGDSSANNNSQTSKIQ
jgi:heme exporter protein D